MNELIRARAVSKRYGKKIALDNIDLTIAPGKIVGLIGPNGAGKTSLLKGILGLAPVEGELSVLGMNPQHERVKLLEQVSFIADTATLPRWMRVKELIDYTEAVHPRFSRASCMKFLADTNLQLKDKVEQLSKGMVTQLHLALIMAIDSQLLVLDEPTLGLDIIYRKQFYESLLNDYYDAQKTILITTHQVEEIESILTDLVFISGGKILLNASMETVADTYVELQVDAPLKAQALAHNPIHVRNLLGGYGMLYENCQERDALAALGRLAVPSLSDLFVAKVKPQINMEGVV
ncbi:ABC transporter ATP-binding protein [Cellvibrio sp. KY-GH-1]|uniref:ABC transporter ATP-binding protein n=1 Tax=Cellvibrio sp. KY-GH-1 TaxID=2303332 RepID=UPI001243F7C1|nr:ABC transporter ATP-binding protein [Cellvibrio sp. KY-GH-1]QEY16852.1 ABC transporter ATP-binding protein [Cellvibrio sp. KY-GH-1]